MNWFNNLPDAEIVALCDLDKIRLQEAEKQLHQVNPDARTETYTTSVIFLTEKTLMLLHVLLLITGMH